jgi:hypothetical protein
MTGSAEAITLTLVPHEGAAAAQALREAVGAHPHYRNSVQPSRAGGGGRPIAAEGVLIAVLGSPVLIGFFSLLKTFAEQRRTEVSVRVAIGDREIEVTVSGRADPGALAAQILETVRPAIDPPGTH